MKQIRRYHRAALRLPCVPCLLVLLIGLLVWSPALLAGTDADSAEAKPVHLRMERLDSVYRFQNDGSSEISSRGRIRVLSELGRQMIGQFFVPFSSELETLEFEYLRTVKSDGELLGVSPASLLELTAPVAQMAPSFTDYKLKGGVLPDLQVGDAVEYHVVHRRHSPHFPGQFWAVHYPFRHYPIEEETVTLELPASRAFTLETSTPGEESIDEERSLHRTRWRLGPSDPLDPVDLPGKSLFAMSSLTGWNQLGQWLAGMYAEQSKATPEVAALAKTLVEGMDSPRERVSTIYGFVATKIRYVSISFGIGQIKPRQAAEVLRTGYGDCKDKHVLLAALLSALEVESSPVFINNVTGTPEEAVPVPTQFNHVMSLSTLAGEQIWMDATVEVLPMGVLPASHYGLRGLLAFGTGGHVVDLPKEEARCSKGLSTFTGSIDHLGNLQAQFESTAEGNAQAQARQAARRLPAETFALFLKVYAESLVPGSEIVERQHSDPEDLTIPYSAAMALSRPAYLNPLELRESQKIPSAWIDRFGWPHEALADEDPGVKKEDPENGGSEIELGGPYFLEDSFRIEIDPVYSIDLPLPLERKLGFASYRAEYRAEENTLIGKRTLEIQTSAIPAELRGQLRNLWKVVTDDLSQEVVFRRKAPAQLSEAVADWSADQLEDLGKEIFGEGRVGEAIVVLELAVEKEPEHRSAWNTLGAAYLPEARFDDAEQAFRRQTEVNPFDEKAHGLLGRLFIVRGKMEDAREELSRHLEINPLDGDAAASLATIHSWSGDWTQSARALERAVRSAPDDATLRARLAEALYNAGESEKAEEQLVKGLVDADSEYERRSITRSAITARYDLERISDEASKRIQAIPSALEALADAGRWPEYFRRLGDLAFSLEALGRIALVSDKLDKAGAFFEAAFELNWSPAVALQLSEYHARRGMLDSSLRLYAFGKFTERAGAPPPDALWRLLEKRGRKLPSTAELHLEGAKLAFQRRVEAKRSEILWPDSEFPEASYTVRVVVRPGGKISKTKYSIIEGEDPFAGISKLIATRTRFPSVKWPNGELWPARTIELLFKPRTKFCEAWWSYSDRPLDQISWVNLIYHMGAPGR